MVTALAGALGQRGIASGLGAAAAAACTSVEQGKHAGQGEVERGSPEGRGGVEWQVGSTEAASPRWCNDDGGEVLQPER
jgi:hypothetical protein